MPFRFLLSPHDTSRPHPTRSAASLSLLPASRDVHPITHALAPLWNTSVIVLTQLWLTPGLTAVCSSSEWASVQAQRGNTHTHRHVNVLETSGTGAQLSVLDAIRFSFSLPFPSICLPASLLEHLTSLPPEHLFFPWRRKTGCMTSGFVTLKKRGFCWGSGRESEA